MFTGLVEGVGKITEMRRVAEGLRLAVAPPFPVEELVLGESVSVSGACLTVVAVKGRAFQADVSPETLARSTLSVKKVGDQVNLERALRLGDRLGGHLVSGHIDGIGVISDKKAVGNAIIITFRVPETLADYMIEKGSVAVDGISLTINHCSRDHFDVSMIPHTAKLTTLGIKNIGTTVNIETDMIGKYVERFVKIKTDTSRQDKTERPSVDMDLLAKTGFL